MAFDFSKLDIPTSEERSASDAARLQRIYSSEDRERDAASKKAVTITLTEEPRLRVLPSGDRVVVLRGVQDGQSSPMAAVYPIPARSELEEQGRSDFDRTLRAMGGGDRMSLAGNWSKRSWKDSENRPREAWEFKAQHMARGDVPLEGMLSTARAVDPDKDPQRTVAPAAAAIAARSSGLAA